MTLMKVIVLTFAYYHPERVLPDTVVQMYAKDLADLPVDKCIDAYERWRRNPANKVFPRPAEIRELVNPEEFVSVEAKAREIAARIVGAVPKFGWNNGKEARVFIGEEGWSVVQRQGGWSHVCQSLSSYNMNSYQAQLRDQLAGSLKYGRENVENSIGALPEGRARTSQLESIGNVLSLINQKQKNEEAETDLTPAG
ncbi:MAG: hypothetical protein AB7H97_04055 [Pseudobdellovibrionaceae bacterium]